jgi:capsular exopolysaccharide synthesis family protein
VTVRRQATVADLLAAANEIQQQIVGTEAELAELEKPITALDAQIVAAGTAAARASLTSQRDQLQQDIARKRLALETRRSGYADQLDKLRLASNLTQTGGAQIVSQAEPSTSPVKPTPRRDAIVALFVGLLLGVGVAFLREYLDDSVRTKEDLDIATDGLPVLAMVPEVESWKDRKVPTLVSLTDPKSAAAEAYRALRTSVQFLGIEQPMTVIQVTSPTSSEGKTTTIANLGVALARAGKRVVIVDCDLRRPRVESFFGIDNTTGFTSVLIGDVVLADAVQRVPDEPWLAVLPAGPAAPNPSELLSLGRAREIFDNLRTHVDYVLVDGPPVLPVADAIVLAGMVDATLLIATARVTSKRQVHRALELLRQVDAPLIGSILNGLEHGSAGYGYGDPYYRYGETNGRPDRQGRWPFRRNSNGGAATAPPPVERVKR